ncbi:unnamed protein product [Ascophyllum nodosum]
MRLAGCLSQARCFAAAALAVMVVTATPRAQGDQESVVQKVHALEAKRVPQLNDRVRRIHNVEFDEARSIHAVKIPFLQDGGDWACPGKSISMGSYGEPKSGTTWTERVITELAIKLCGSSTNTWCKMGGMEVYSNIPAPSYIWEMLYAGTGTLFLHFDGRIKHTIAGLNVGEGCNTRGRGHVNSFDRASPCRHGVKEPTRESLFQCLPDTSKRCAQLMPSRDPAVLRMAIVFRDPRDVIISEHRMRIGVFHRANTSDIAPFIFERFETIVSWQFVRWMWHTTFYKNASHVMFYEDIQSKPEALADLAAFMGLSSSLEQIQDVYEIHKNRSPQGSYIDHGLPIETIEYMNATMSKLLPEEMTSRYGLLPDLSLTNP